MNLTFSINLLVEMRDGTELQVKAPNEYVL